MHSISIYVNAFSTFSYKSGLFSNIFRSKSQLKIKLYRIFHQLGIGTRKAWAARGILVVCKLFIGFNGKKKEKALAKMFKTIKNEKEEINIAVFWLSLFLC